jgi:hypothetical protein
METGQFLRVSRYMMFCGNIPANCRLFKDMRFSVSLMILLPELFVSQPFKEDKGRFFGFQREISFIVGK